MKTLLRTCITLVTWLLAAQAQAIQISSAGDSWTVDWDLDIGLTSNLTATSSWTVTSFSSTQIVLDIRIQNTTLLSGTLTNADITSFGFGIDPNATASLLTAGTTFASVGSGSGPQQTFPGGFKLIDVCIFSGNCSGGSVKNALHAGASDSLQLLLTGDFSGGSANLLYFPAKFQTSLGSYAPPGCVNCQPTTVPEPPMVALLGIGLLLIGLGRRGKPRFAAAG